MDDRFTYLYFCVEAPCSYQEPRIVLSKLSDGRYECPKCERIYSIEFIANLVPVAGYYAPFIPIFFKAK